MAGMGNTRSGGVNTGREADRAKESTTAFAERMDSARVLWLPWGSGAV